MLTQPQTHDPRDTMLGRARVTDTPELEGFYDDLARQNSGAFWKRANAIEPWEPESRYRPTLWRYAAMRALCLRAVELEGNVLRAGHGGTHQALVVRKFGFDVLLVLDALGFKHGNAGAHLCGYFRQW